MRLAARELGRGVGAAGRYMGGAVRWWLTSPVAGLVPLMGGGEGIAVPLRVHGRASPAEAGQRAREMLVAGSKCDRGTG